MREATVGGTTRVNFGGSFAWGIDGGGALGPKPGAGALARFGTALCISGTVSASGIGTGIPARNAGSKTSPALTGGGGGGGARASGSCRPGIGSYIGGSCRPTMMGGIARACFGGGG